MKKLRDEMQASLNIVIARSEQGDLDYDVDTWIYVLEMVLRRIDYYMGEEE